MLIIAHFSPSVIKTGDVLLFLAVKTRYHFINMCKDSEGKNPFLILVL
jgi:hypothetical protein